MLKGSDSLKIALGSVVYISEHSVFDSTLKYSEQSVQVFILVLINLCCVRDCNEIYNVPRLE